MCEVQHFVSWISNASDPRLISADVSHGGGNPYMFWSKTLNTLAFSTQANEWVEHGKLLAESNLKEMFWGSLALADIPFRGNSKAGSLVRTETTGS